MTATEDDRKAAYRYIAAVLEGTVERGCGGLSPSVGAEVVRICKTLKEAGAVPRRSTSRRR